MRAPRIAAGVCLLLALASAGAAAQVAVARVNGEPIPVDALERAFQQELGARNLNIANMRRPEKVAEIKREVLERLIREELLWQKARADGLVATDAEVDRALERTAAQYRTHAAYERSLSRGGYDERGFRDHARRLMSADRAADALVKGKLAVSDEDVARFYRDNAARFHRAEQLRLRVLQLRPAPDARGRIEALRKRLAAGEDFDALAREASEHPTQQWGGALDPVPHGQLPAALDEAAFRLGAGEISGIIEAADGLYLLKLEERLPEATVPLEAARERIRDYLTGLRGREVLDREIAALRAASKVEILLPQ